MPARAATVQPGHPLGEARGLMDGADKAKRVATENELPWLFPKINEGPPRQVFRRLSTHTNCAPCVKMRSVFASQSSVPSSSAKTLQRSVLLIEEYAALSVAIQSALTKFAPQHRFHAVSSLADARLFARDKKRELTILYSAPPLQGAIAFFGEMK